MCTSSSQPVLGGMLFSRVKRVAGVQFSIPVSVTEPVIPTMGTIDTRISVRMSLPVSIPDTIRPPRYEKLRNVYVSIASNDTETELVPRRTYGTLNTNIGVPVYLEKISKDTVSAIPRYESIRNIKITSHISLPNPMTDVFLYPTYEKLRNVQFWVKIPDIPIVPISTVQPLAIIPRYEKLRNVNIPVSIPQTKHELAIIPKLEKLRDIHVSASPPQASLDTMIRTYTKIHTTFDITIADVMSSLERFQEIHIPVSTVQNTKPIYDINPTHANPHFEIRSIHADTPKEIVFGGGSKSPDDYVLYGGGNSQLLL
jgi:hypothetical protein